MKQFLLLCMALGLLTGCDQDGLRARYRAEKARYWAERQALEFSLQSDPQRRRRYYESGLAYLEVAQIASPVLHEGDLPPGLSAELLELDAWGRLQAGGAFLRAGYFEQAEPELSAVQAAGPERYRREAALLRAEAARARRLWDPALLRYGEFQKLLLEDPENMELDDELLELPVSFLSELQEGASPELVEVGRQQGHAFYAGIIQEWPGTALASRAAFLDHRLDLVAGHWAEALAGLERYAGGELGEGDQWNARFGLAEILGPGMQRTEEALVIYEEIGKLAPEPYLRGLAWMRRGELLLEAGRTEEGLEALAFVEEEFRQYPETASAAIYTRAQYLEQMGDWSEALQLYRRIIMRHPDTQAGIMAPLEMVELQRARGDERGADGALLGAETQYRRLVAGHSLDGPVGLQARRSLIQCLLMAGKPEEALAELEQLHHILGRGPGGAEALLDAARIAGSELEDPDLSRRYLEWIVRELPVTPAAAKAREMLEEMGELPSSRVGD